MIAAGIVDPTKVTRSALENAATVAAMVLTTESLVADLPRPPAPGAAAGGDMGGMYSHRHRYHPLRPLRPRRQQLLRAAALRVLPGADPAVRAPQFHQPLLVEIGQSGTPADVLLLDQPRRTLPALLLCTCWATSTRKAAASPGSNAPGTLCWPTPATRPPPSAGPPPADGCWAPARQKSSPSSTAQTPRCS